MFRNIGTKERLVDRVVIEIQEQIIGGNLPPGTMLPPERELCDQLGVSRTALREGVRMLASKGLLETRPGVGTIVKRVSSNQISEPLSILLNQEKDLTLAHLHEVRRMLEIQISRFAAVNATEEDVCKLQTIVDNMEEAVDDAGKFSLLDAEFHRTLAESTQNPLLAILLDSIRDLFLDILVKVQVRSHQVNYTLPEHRKIVQEVAAHNPDGAAEAMRIHLENARMIMRDRYLELK